MSTATSRWNGVLTDAGSNMIGQLSSDNKLIVTKVMTASGYVPVEDMRSSTALVSPVTIVTLKNIIPLSSGTMFKITIGPHTTAYSLISVGIFAKVGVSGQEKLFALMQYLPTDSSTPTGITIPTTTDFPDFALNLSAPLAVLNSDIVTFSVDPDAYASYSDLQALALGTVGEIKAWV